MHRIRIFRDGEHYRTVFFVKTLDTSTPNDGVVNNSIEIESPTSLQLNPKKLLAYLDTDETVFAFGLKPCIDDVVYTDNAYFHRNDNGEWGILPNACRHHESLCRKAVMAETGYVARRRLEGIARRAHREYQERVE